MKKVKSLGVYFNGRRVGTLARHREYLAAFQYDSEWIAGGFSISPFSLPLDGKVYIPKPDPFEGLFGVFSDSLPDGWGRLLVDRYLLKIAVNPHEAGNLERLATVGETGMGALAYRPDFNIPDAVEAGEYDRIAVECKKILKEEPVDDLDSLFRMGGSSGGARPKILTTVDGGEWIIKFPSGDDRADIGRQEYDYSVCARECGIEMEETRLFPSKLCGGYFGTKRFDVAGKGDNAERVHMISVSRLLETSHRIPNLDYDTLMKLTMILTNDMCQVEKLYRLMCFNVFAHNRDDHSKNFSFLYKEDEARWILSPAYDLTYSSSLGGEHATTVHGNGKNPGREELLMVAKGAGLDKKKAALTADQIYECTRSMLGKYLG